LGQEGTASSGDHVIICFWTPNTSNLADTNLIQWGLIDITLTSDSTYVRHIQIQDAFAPNISFALSGATTVDNNVFVNDTGCNDSHSWVFSTSTIRQTPSISGVAMFSGMNTLPTTAIDIDWDDASTSLDQNPGGNYSHQFTQSGDYTISTVTTNVSGLTTPWNDTLRIYWNPGSATFSIDNNTPDPIGTTGIGELVTFTNTTVDVDSRMNAAGFEWYWDWDIVDTGAYGTFTQNLTNQFFGASPTHQWKNPGSANITLTLHYYDGFAWQTDTEILGVTQQIWDVATGLNWPTPVIANDSVIYTPSVTGDVAYITDVDYNVNTTPTYTELGYTDSFSHTFLTTQTQTIRQILNYHDGFAFTSKFNDFTVDMGTVASFTYIDSDCNGKVFTDASVFPNLPQSYLRWEVIDIDTLDILAVLENESEFVYNWYKTGNYRIELTASDSSAPVSTDTYSEDFIIDTCPSSGGGSGGTSGYGSAYGSGISERPKIIEKIVYKEKPKNKINFVLKSEYNNHFSILPNYLSLRKKKSIKNISFSHKML